MKELGKIENWPGGAFPQASRDRGIAGRVLWAGWRGKSVGNSQNGKIAQCFLAKGFKPRQPRYACGYR